MIDLAGWLSIKITGWERARRGASATNSKLTPEERTASARNAGRNRWKNK